MAEAAFYMRDYKGERIKLLPFYKTDFLFAGNIFIIFDENLEII